MCDKGGTEHEENVSAQKASQTEGPWLQKKNVYRQRPQGSGQKTRPRQSQTELLIHGKQFRAVLTVSRSDELELLVLQAGSSSCFFRSFRSLGRDWRNRAASIGGEQVLS